MTASTRKQFNLSHIHVDEKLQGARLASFSRRFIAYSIDWIIIGSCTEFIWLVIPLLLLLLLFKGKLKNTLTKSRRIIKRSVIGFGRKLEDNTTIEPTLKKRFTKGIVAYLYILLYLPIACSVLYLVFIFIQYLSPQFYEEMTVNTASFLHILTKPLYDLTDAMGLLVRFFGAFVYFSVFNWRWNGQTPGKRLLGIGIVKLNGTKLTFWNSLERVSGYTASASIVFLGFLQYFWDRNGQTTHDKITETIVIEV